jgi:hypothetical protein
MWTRLRPLKFKHRLFCPCPFRAEDIAWKKKCEWQAKRVADPIRKRILIHDELRAAEKSNECDGPTRRVVGGSILIWQIEVWLVGGNGQGALRNKDRDWLQSPRIVPDVVMRSGEEESDAVSLNLGKPLTAQGLENS